MIEALLHKEISIDVLIRFIPSILAFYFAIKQLLYKAITKKARIYIGLFYLSFGLIQILSILYFLKCFEYAKLYLLIYVPVILLIAPLFFLYIKEISQQAIYKIKNYFHFLPAILVFISLCILYFIYTHIEDNTELKSTIYNIFWFVIMASTMVLFLVQNAFYIFSILLTYKKHKQSIKEIFSYDSGISLKWVKLYILGYILFVFTISLSELIKFSFYNLTVETILIIYLLYSSYYTLKQKEVYSSVIRHEKNKPIKVEDKTQLESTKVKENKYEGSSLKDDAKIQEIKAKLVSLLETEKPYLNPKLSIYDISNNLDINYKYLSQVINQEMHMSFINFINHYRIEASLQLLISKENEQYTIEAISEMAGFNSKSAFNTCFKKQIGETPSQYRKKNIS